ncbi:beta-propeller domain-containing protein [Sutcliffiella halmapala]|uniref:beta-propeller domain-containing protein n=1 Tax=Sutcliffiella halmapala TaxID=79882 RepID=UPI00099495CB|nr:beta-propeller domain-containing protein [Sutcliffiella halmapala]
MKKRAIIFVLLLSSLAILIGIIQFNYHPFVVNSTVDSSKMYTVLSNKKWVLSFSEEFKKESVTEDTIYVTNKDGERVAISLSFAGDNVLVIPPEEGYPPNKSPFELHVGTAIESIDGRTLQSGEKFKFHAKEDLPTISSKKELNKLFNDRLVKVENQFGRSGRFSSEVMEDSDNAEAESSTVADSSSGSKESSSFSETNVQVQGVDEADIVKNDGEYIFQAIDHKLKITKALPVDEMETVAEINYKDFAPFQMFVDEDQLVLIGHYWKETYEPYQEGQDRSFIMPMYDATRVIVYDISDRTNPVVEKTLTLEGSYVSSRKIEEHVYIISNQYPNYWLLQENPEVDLRPRILETLEDSEESDGTEKSMKRVDYSDIRYFPDSSEDNFMTIASFDLKNPTDDATIFTYLGSGQQIYMSKENLYVAVPSYSHSNGRNWFANENTDFYKFSVDGLHVEYSGTGSIPGYLLNQFSMDEYNGYFRVAATKGQAWDEQSPSSNNLFIMDEQLNVVSSVEGLARGERIYSVRFMQEKAYVVTFKEVDPLFVFDLSNPNDPKVLGELKIPGFSSYLHPYDENHLIGFGQDTKVEKDQFGTRVVTNGVKISLFDVSDPTNPLEKFTEIIGGQATYSPLNHDHKALLSNKEKDIFAFPIVVYSEKDKHDYRFEFEGALVYGIDLDKGFTLHTKMTHQKENTPYEDWENSIQRVIQINDHLYAISPKQITASKITW